MRRYVEAMTSVLCGIPCSSEPCGRGLIELDAMRVADIHATLDPAARGQVERCQARFSKLMAGQDAVYAEAQELIAHIQGLIPLDDGDDQRDDDDLESKLPEGIGQLADSELSALAKDMRRISDAALSELHKRGLPAPV